MTSPEENPKELVKAVFELIDPEKLIENLPLKKGSVVLDLACGKGVYRLFFPKYAGDTGLIYAVALWKEGLLLLDEQIKKKQNNLFSAAGT